MIKSENLDFWIQNNYNVLLVGEHGVGKCLGKGTPVLMYNGEIKRVEDIQLNDLLMGPDSKPRCVLSINQGREEMFRITPTKGDSFECNKSHILCLKMAGKNEIIEITLADYLKSNKTFRSRAMLFRNSVNFSAIDNLPQPAYLLGLWLGDGTTSKSQFTSIDLEILDYLCEYANKRKLFFKPSKIDGITYDLNSGPNSVGKMKIGRNEFLTFLKEFNLLNNKHIPLKYLTSSEEDRLELLAGLIDTDGELSNNCFSITQKSNKLSNDILYLCRSLGFAAYSKKCVKYCIYKGVKRSGEYNRITISGDIIRVNCLLKRKLGQTRKQVKDVLKTSINKVESLGEGDYYGFTIDGDGRFMLGDFTVTHNTSIVKDAFERNGLKWRYYSASTMDPWVDLVGVPKEKQNADGTSYLDLVRPKEFQEDSVEALFFDEFNRCLTGDTEIDLVNGESVKIKDLIGLEEFFVYSYDLKSKKICVGRGHSALKTKINEKILKITLDNGQSFRCTVDHPLLLREGRYFKAEDCKIGDSLMPLRKRISSSTKNSPRAMNGYEQVYQVEFQKYVWTHVLADEFNLKNDIYKIESGNIRHHKNFNKLDNSPKNIIRMTHSAHTQLHLEAGHNGGVAAHFKHPDLYSRTIGTVESNVKAVEFATNFNIKNIQDYDLKRSQIKGSGKTPPTSERVVELFGSFDDFLETLSLNNHKIVNIEEDGYEDVYDITVDDYHNFGLSCGVFVHNSHKKVRNAVMELLQFKSINGKSFPSLKIIWAAINPEGDDTYDVERLDPAQEDRFQIKVTVPYKPHRSYFSNRFGEDVAKAAISWWADLPQDQKKLVSPRRLDYALDVLSKGGDVRYVLPVSTNVSKLITTLEIGPISDKLKDLRKSEDTEAAKEFLLVENNYNASVKYIVNNPANMNFFLPCLPNEKLSKLIYENANVRKSVLDRIEEYEHFKQVANDIIAANANKQVSKYIIKYAEDHKIGGIDGTMGNVNIGTKPIKPYHSSGSVSIYGTYVEQARKILLPKVYPYIVNTQERKKAYDLIYGSIPASMSTELSLMTLECLNIIVSRSQKSTIIGLPKFFGITNHCINILCKNENIKHWKDLIKKYDYCLKSIFDKCTSEHVLGRKIYAPNPKVEAQWHDEMGKPCH